MFEHLLSRRFIVVALVLILPVAGISPSAGACQTSNAASGERTCCCQSDCHCGSACANGQNRPAPSKQAPLKPADRRDLTGSSLIAGELAAGVVVSLDAALALASTPTPGDAFSQTLVALHTCLRV
jgi:hypothetical protein